MVLISALVMAAATAPAPKHVTIDQPFAASASATENITTITETVDLFTTLSGASSVIMHDFALDLDTRVVLDLDRRNIIAENATLLINEDGVMATPDVAMFGGTIAGDEDSLVYIAFSENMTLGYINTNGSQYIISSGPSDQGLDTVIYNTAEIPEGSINFMEMACNAIPVPDEFRQTGTTSGPAIAALGEPPCRVANMAIETDTEFRTDLFGGDAGDASDYATMLVGAVSEVYERDLNVILNISFLRIWTSNDPWNQNGGTVDQLFQFRDYWNANMTGEDRSGAHFFSGRSLGGGVAYVGAICVEDFDYALSANLNGFFPYPIQDESDQNWDLMVTAHEWGHNFGAPHTHQQSPLSNIDNCGSSGDCSQVPGTIMSYCHLCGNGTADMNMEFHPQNINSWMLAYLDSTGLYDGEGAPCDLTGNPLCEPDTCLADVNGDGAVTPTDFTAWVGAYNSNAPECDQNGDGMCTPTDFSAWVSNYNAGCD